jgi:Flp pilus assembly protein TadD
MGQIIKFPAPAAKLGYRPVKKRSKAAASGEQLNLFSGSGAQILSLESGLDPFEQALLLDERSDPKAAEGYEKAIAAGDCVSDAYCNLGIIESNLGNTTKALDCFTTALKHDARHSEAHYNLGNLYFELNDFRLAQVHYEMAAQVDPSFANAYFNLALVQGLNHELANAVNSLTRYQELVSPEDGRVAEELLQNLLRSLEAVSKPGLGST